MMVGAATAVSNNSNPLRNTSNCLSPSCGAPNGRPIKNGVSSRRGTCIGASRPAMLAMAITTVGNPAASNTLETCPTDTWQTGQAGTSSIPSMPCCLSICAHCGAFFFSSGVWAEAPTNE